MVIAKKDAGVLFTTVLFGQHQDLVLAKKDRYSLTTAFCSLGIEYLGNLKQGLYFRCKD